MSERDVRREAVAETLAVNLLCECLLPRLVIRGAYGGCITYILSDSTTERCVASVIDMDGCILLLFSEVEYCGSGWDALTSRKH
jgi:hypothetical protein